MLTMHLNMNSDEDALCLQGSHGPPGVPGSAGLVGLPGSKGEKVCILIEVLNRSLGVTVASWIIKTHIECLILMWFVSIRSGPTRGAWTRCKLQTHWDHEGLNERISMNLCSAANRVCDLYLCSGFSRFEGREGRPGGQRREGEDALGKDIWLFIAEVQPPACQRCLCCHTSSPPGWQRRTGTARAEGPEGRAGSSRPGPAMSCGTSAQLTSTSES